MNKINKKTANAINKGVKKSLKGKKTFDGKSTRLGGGGQFAKLSSAIQAKGTPKAEADAIAAKVGMKTLGKEKFEKLAQVGRKRAITKLAKN